MSMKPSHVVRTIFLGGLALFSALLISACGDDAASDVAHAGSDAGLDASPGGDGGSSGSTDVSDSSAPLGNGGGGATGGGGPELDGGSLSDASFLADADVDPDAGAANIDGAVDAALDAVGDGGPVDSEDSGTDGCAPVAVDYVVAVDTSSSMTLEAAEVQNNINELANTVLAEGIDLHIVVIGTNICVPAPLGSGSCPSDELLPRYRHVASAIASTDALDVILATYSSWSLSLREGSQRRFLVVSDDESASGAASFTSQLQALDAGAFDGFVFDAIVASTSPDSCAVCAISDCGSCANPCCDKANSCQALSDERGLVYEDLVQQTGGVLNDQCAQTFSPFFQGIAGAVIGASCL